MNSKYWGLLLLVIAMLLALPALLSQSLVNAAIQMLIAALFACSFNLLCGQGGMLSFGHATYFGVGTFATVHAMNAFNGAGLLPTPLMPLAGAVIGLVVGVVAGWFATQRSGTYFAMITLALAELLHALAPHLKGIFGGEAGISAMRMPAWGWTFGSSNEVYYLTLVWVLISLGLLYLYTLTPVGRLTLGLRENAQRLQFLGYDVHRLKVVVFAISAMFAGIAGGLQALNTESANYVLLEVQHSAAVVLNSYIGGVNVFLGPALGAALMTFFGYAVSDLTRAWLLYQGILFVLVMMYMPSGLAGFVQWIANNRKTQGWFAMLPLMAVAAVAGLLLASATVFSVEMLQRFFSQDYRSLASFNGGGAWPPIALFGREWAPGSLLTWLVPMVCLGLGLSLVQLAKRLWRAMVDKAETAQERLRATDAGLAPAAVQGVSP
ncbi:branched-chain amino acid ABC transporter permease [Comamonas sp. JUb58]|uniref:branched-chain amino acid ABC transporter permease n=1 Tax=Comamonas sp. JUb58 TaxID=2485114 RepID=UPI00105CD6AF|nr:branched-chain amino acid ABC transporter permease [Comamonas sp. JUb58]TDS78207.1 amino acid/amide ABC transporter membrane protein 2 (HAAT family) [Comamonas sp. JUb58]